MKNIFFLVALPAIIVSCKKNDNDSPQPCPVQQSTVAGRYVITAIKYKASASAAEQDVFSGLDSCQRDDVYQLMADSTVIIGTGATVCPGPPPPGGITVWYVTADGKQFSFDEIYDIVSFDCTTLVVNKKDYNVPGDSRTVTMAKQ